MLHRIALIIVLFLYHVAYSQKQKPGIISEGRQGEVHKVSEKLTATEQSQLQNKERQSWYGYGHTPKGVLHTLIVYVVFEGDEAHADGWKPGSLPDYALKIPSALISKDTSLTGNFVNITDWFKVMSGDSFVVTGEVFLVKIEKEKFRLSNGSLNFSPMYGAALAALQTTYPKEDWSRFDKRQNIPAWEYDNSRYCRDGSPAKGDGVVDYTVINFRNLEGPVWTGASEASIFGGYPLKCEGGEILSFGAGHTAHFMGVDSEHHHDYFRHEFSHVLFNAPHYMGANNLCGAYFYTNKGWGIMGETHKPWNTPNAWEAAWLGWNKAQTVRSNGTYMLKDFVTTHDAIRIPIYGGQILWLENHQMKHAHDHKLFYNTESPMGEGVYAFISARGNDNKHPEDFIAANPVNTNSMKILSAKGNWDYSWTDTIPYWRFDKLRENPVAGQTDLTLIRLNYKKDHIIPVNSHWNNEGGGNRSEQSGVLNESGKVTYAWSGAAKDGFHKGDVIGKSGIVPAFNYPVYNEKEARLEPYLINGTTVKLTNYDAATGTYTVDVKLNDYTVTANKRWCGDLLLKNLTGNPLPDLIIGNGVSVLLNMSGTPNTHLQTYGDDYYPNFARPTTLVLSDTATLQLAGGSRLHISDSSTIDIGANCKIEVLEGALLALRKNSKMYCSAYGSLVLRENGKLLLEDEGVSFYRSKGALYMQTRGGTKKVTGELITVLAGMTLKSVRVYR